MYSICFLQFNLSSIHTPKYLTLSHPLILISFILRLVRLWSLLLMSMCCWIMSPFYDFCCFWCVSRCMSPLTCVWSTVFLHYTCCFITAEVDNLCNLVILATGNNLEMASALFPFSLWNLFSPSVSYTHLTLPTNREV